MPTSNVNPAAPISHQQGFTYVALLLVIALMGVGLAAKGVSWSGSTQRDKEAELLFIGEEFREAIALYYFRSPGQAQEYPKSLDDLLMDARSTGTQRYLRKIYRDPVTNQREWGLVLTPTGRIMGVHSLSKEKPLKTENFSEVNRALSGGNSYADWQFIFVPAAILPSQLSTMPRK